MKDYNQEIKKHELRIRQLKAESKTARQLDQAIVDRVHKAFDMGFNVNHVSEAFGIDKHEVRLVQKRRATESRLLYGRKYKKGSKWKLIQTRGTPEWAEQIRKGHLGEIKRTLVPRCQEVHDREMVCPFCYKSKKFSSNKEGWLKYIEWNAKRQFRKNLTDFPEGRFPRYIKANDKSPVVTTIITDNALPPEVEVQLNGHPLTDDEFEALDVPDEEVQETAKQLLAEDELIQRSERKGLFQKVKDKIQKPHHSAIYRRKENKALEMKAKDLDSATLKRLAAIKEAEEARKKGKEKGQ